MTDREYIRFNTSLATASNAGQVRTDENGDSEARIELRLPDTLTPPSVTRPIRKIEMQASKLRVSMSKLPVATFTINNVRVSGEVYHKKGHQTGILTTAAIQMFPYILDQNGVMQPETRYNDGNTYRAFLPGFHPHTSFVYLAIPPNRMDAVTIEGDKAYINDIGVVEQMFQDAFDYVFAICNDYPERPLNSTFRFGSDTFSLSYNTALYERYTNTTHLPLLYGTQGVTRLKGTFARTGHPDLDPLVPFDFENPQEAIMPWTLSGTSSGVDWRQTTYALPYNIVGNQALRDAVPFLPWIRRKATYNLPPPTVESSEAEKNAFYHEPFWQKDAGMSDYYFILDALNTTFNAEEAGPIVKVYGKHNPEATQWSQKSGITVTWEWRNVPMVLMSPVQSIVLMMNGTNVTQQIHPVNIAQPSGSSLTTAVPIIENYYSLASSIRDLHDELVISREAFTNTPLFTINPQTGIERTLTFEVYYITKDGRMHKVFVNPSGIFALQITFCVYY